MKQKSVLIIGIILFWCFGGILILSIYSNLRLQSFQETLSTANRLLMTWNRSESSTRELFMTYELEKARENWLEIKNQFQNSMDSFLQSSGIKKINERDSDIRLTIEMMKIYWVLNQQMFDGFDDKLRSYISNNKSITSPGKVSLTLGEDVFIAKNQDTSLDLLRDLIWSPFFHIFTQTLTRVNNQIEIDIQKQSKRLRFTYLIFSILILGTTGIFILYRMSELKKSQEEAKNHAIALSAEIDERKHTENLLRTERDKLRSVMNALGDGIYIIDSDYIIEYQNEVLVKRRGDLIGRRCYTEYMKSSEACDICLAKKTIQTNKMHRTDVVLNNDKNYELVFSPFKDVHGKFKAIIVMRDVTEVKRLEAETMRAGHLASLGELAAGVAHEINNPINSIISVAEILRDQNPKEDANKKIPKMIIKEGERIANIIRNLLSFARDQSEEYGPSKIHNIMNDTLGLVEKQIRKDGIKLTVDVPSTLPMVKAKSLEIQQVFLNIISNARYALNQKSTGISRDKKIKIESEIIEGETGKYIRTTFTDHGTGIQKDIIDKICNPFFTSKPKGEGTGLGLSISHGIIQNHGGRISFKSKPGSFTKVFIDLPLWESEILLELSGGVS